MKGKRLLIESRNRRIRPLADEIGRLDARELKTLQDAAGIVQGMIAQGR
jgi:hypothetical protein